MSAISLNGLLSTAQADFNRGKVALANITHFRQATRLTAKRRKVAAQQKGFVLYTHLQAEELRKLSP